jgi:hypothetical protein
MVQSRIFVKQGPSCDYSIAQVNSALVAAVLPWAITKGIGLAADELKQHAAYLKSDVGIQGNGYIQYGSSNFWPNGDALNTSRTNAINAAHDETQRKYDGNISAQALQATMDESGKKAAAVFDRQAYPASPSNYDLCVLMVAGEYSSSPEYSLGENGSKILDNFLKAAGAQGAKIRSYEMNRRGAAQAIVPFDNLVYEPSLVAEFHLSSVSVDKNRRITATPTNVYYPAPLHKGTFNIGERKLSLELTMETNKVLFSIPNAKSGFNYMAADLIGLDKSFDVDANVKYLELSVKAVEGPDTLNLDVPLEALAEQKDNVTKKALEATDKFIDKKPTQSK